MNCPACDSNNIKNFFKKDNTPIFQNIKYKNKKEALNAKCDTLDLKMCKNCGMIHNFTFKSDVVDYNNAYENSQFNSNKYMDYINNIIYILQSKYNINKTKIVEIGCGNGKFLSLITKATNSNGIGYDPAFQGNLTLTGGGKTEYRN